MITQTQEIISVSIFGILYILIWSYLFWYPRFQDWKKRKKEPKASLRESSDSQSSSETEVEE